MRARVTPRLALTVAATLVAGLITALAPPAQAVGTPTTTTITQLNPGNPIEDGGTIGLEVLVTEQGGGQAVFGTVYLERTDVSPAIVVSGVLEYPGRAYFGVATHPGATYVAVFPGSNDHLPSSSTPLTADGVVRTPIITVFGPTETTIDQGQTYTTSGLVQRAAPGGLRPVAGLAMELWATPGGGVPATKVATVTSAANGTFSYTDTPHNLRQYQWRHAAGEGGYEAATADQYSYKTVILRTLSTVQIVSVTPTSLPSLPTVRTASVIARLTDHWGSPLAGRTLTVVHGGRTCGCADPAVTDADGYATLTIRFMSGGPGLGTTGPAHPFHVHFQGYPMPTADSPLHPPADSPDFSVAVVHPTTLTGSVVGGPTYPGGSATVAAQLAFDVPDAARRPLTLWRLDGADWTQVGTTTTLLGAARLVVTPSAPSTSYQWRYAGDVESQPAVSGVIVVDVTEPPVVPPAATVMTATATGATLTGNFARVDGRVDVSPHTFELWSSVGGAPYTKQLTKVSTGYRPTATVALVATTVYQWRFVGTSALASSSSNAVTVGVVPKVTFTVSKASVRSGGTVVFTGILRPGRAGIKVYLQRGSKRLATVTTSRSGRYRGSVRFTTKGVTSLRVVTARAGDLGPVSSVVKKVRVR